jgi:hypothetical protein
LAFCFALTNAGSNMAARIAMIAITTSSSIKVNAREKKPNRRRLKPVLNRCIRIVIGFFIKMSR